MSEGDQIRAMDDYFHALLLEEPRPRASATLAAPCREPDARLAQLDRLFVRLDEGREIQAFSHEAVPAGAPAVAGQAPVAQISPSSWENLETDKEFQALFFEVAGMNFAVPLTELGGIQRLGEVGTLLGQPAWYLGIMLSRERKLGVVDTAAWLMPDKAQANPGYQYLIMLGESSWGLACHGLKGTERLRADQIKWRQQAGSRPWLAGMIKQKMCALLHARALLSLLDRGVNPADRRQVHAPSRGFTR